MLDWILKNKENLAWGAGALIGTWRSFIYIRKRWYLPTIKLAQKVLYELNNNGGKSIKDLVEKTNKTVAKLAATNEAMLTISDECIFKCSPDGRCIFANESLCDLYGASHDEMMGYGWINFLAQDERDANEKNWKRAVENDTNISSEYTVVHGTTREKINCYYKAAIRRDETSAIISIIGIVKRK